MANAVKLTTPSDCEVVVTREFEAPRELVWSTVFKPELLKRWMTGPPGFAMTVCEDDTRTGGTYRRVWSGPNGMSMSMYGVYKEIVEPELCVRTQSFEPGGGEQLATLVFTELDERTTVTITFLFDSKESREKAVASGMEQGMAAGYMRLDGVLSQPAE
jgi:uncharacterized protein YndB with AHSA1/START domain